MLKKKKNFAVRGKVRTFALTIIPKQTIDMETNNGESTTKKKIGQGEPARRSPMKLRKFRGYRELVADPYNLGL